MAATKSKRSAKAKPATKTAPKRAVDRETAAAAVILIAATLITYGHVVHQDFVHWDDNLHVFQNPYFARMTPDDLAYFWKHAYEQLYIPVSYMAFALIAQLSRMPHIDHTVTSAATLYNPHVFHAANLVLHTANALIVFAILLKLTQKAWPALIGALLFSLHPLQVESVAWISELRGLLSGFFCLSATYAYLVAVSPPKSIEKEDIRPVGARADESKKANLKILPQSVTRRPSPPGRVAGDEGSGPASPGELGLRQPAYWAALLLTVLAMLAKPSAVSLPIVLFAMDRWIVGRSLRVCALSTAPWLLISITFIAITHFVQHVAPVSVAPVWKRPFIAGDALAFYLGKLVDPTNLTIDYGRTPAVVTAHAWGYLTWLAPAAIATVIFAFRRSRPWLVAAGLISGAYLLPVLGLIPFAFQSFSTVADRYVYLAMLGPAIVVASLLANAPAERSKPAFALAAVVLAAFAVATMKQVTRWNDSLTLFRWAVRLNPHSSGVHDNYGVALDETAADIDGSGPDADSRRRVAYTEAIQQYSEVIALKPDDAVAYTNRGNAIYALGNISDPTTKETDLASAESDYRQATAIAPRIYQAHLALGVILRQENHLDEALREANEAVTLAPYNSRALASLADVLSSAGRTEEAIAAYRRAAAITPDADDIHFALGKALFQDNQAAAAVPELEAAVRIRPTPFYYDRLGIAYAVTGNLPAAQQAFETELSLDPTSTMARAHLAKLQREQQSLPQP